LSIFSSEDANILKSYYVQYFKQAHEILASSDENFFNTLFLKKIKRKCGLKNFSREN